MHCSVFIVRLREGSPHLSVKEHEKEYGFTMRTALVTTALSQGKMRGLPEKLEKAIEVGRWGKDET